MAAVLATFSFAQTAAVGRASDPVNVGASVTFLATADGTPAPTFQWRKNGRDIAGATGAVFTINSVTLEDAAIYQVVASNEAGSAVSPDEELVVQAAPTSTAPVIVTHPTPLQTADAGGTVSFTVAASGNPTPTYQWKKNGVPMPGATNPTLTLIALTTNDNASYVAVATNPAGTATSNAAVLNVTVVSTPPPPPANVAPVITTQPTASQTVTAGDSVSFTASASGVPAPTYQWRKNGVAITGATNATLTLSSVTGVDSASYTVDAVNIAGSVTSSAAVLIVNAPVVIVPPPPGSGSGGNSAPVFTTQPITTQTAITGTSASMSVVVSGNPAPTLQWRKNGTNIAGATSSTLSFKVITAADAATYTVIATNSAGTTVSGNSILVVNSRPIFTTQPAPQAVAPGGTAKFSAVVSAIPGAALQWYKNGAAITGATASVLTVSAASAKDAGTYYVVATNSVGSATSTEVALVIATPPIITSQPVSQTVNAKSNVTFDVAASGSPAPTFQWKKNGVSIAGATGPSLTLKSVNKSDAGDYSVDATNAAGWVSSVRATLSVNNTTGRNPADEDPEGGANMPPVAGADTNGSRLVNLSVRATAGTGDNSLIVGFVVDGPTTKPVLVRGVGPTLREFGVDDVLLDPKLALYTGTVTTASNDDWITNENATQIAATSERVGAFSLRELTADSALMSTLESGAYTVQLSGKDATSGIALVEVYDAASTNASKLVNLSVRAQIGGEADTPNVGFVIAGTTPKQVLIRAAGPALAEFGVTDAIADPQIELFHGAERINQNDNWGGSDSLSTVFARVGAFGFQDPNSKDAVLLVTLDPGAYTVVVSGANGAKGVGLVELYEVP